MGSTRRRVGFWAAVGRLRFKVLVSPEIGGGTVLGVAGSLYMIRKANLADRADLVDSYTALVAALLGIVFAALALVVALFSNEYLDYLDEDGDGEGVIEFLSPFIFAIGLQVAVLLGSVAYGPAAPALPKTAEHWVFGAITTLFVVAALDLVALARNVIMHGVARARLNALRVSEIDEQRSKRRGTGS
jgi:hypothetical protein